MATGAERREGSGGGESGPLGTLQMDVMRDLWREGDSTVRQVRERLNARGYRLAYTTVLTVMMRLARRGYLDRRPVGRAHVYHPAVSEAGLAPAVSREAVERLMRLHGEEALSAFAAHVRAGDPGALARLRALLEEDEG